ncbi:transcription-repair coupling factor, partial [Sphingobacterium shayense]|nr:transcription-repair coupling factor [Sphingobacterium shayense]
MGIKEILVQYTQSEQLKALVKALQSKNPKIHLKGLIGSSDAMIAAAAYTLQERPFIFILPTHEQASYFLSDLESILDKQVLFFPASYRKAFEFTQIDSTHVLQRAETLSALNHASELPKMVVTYPEAIAEKVINRDDLEKNTLPITQNTKLSIDFINEFLYEYDFERVDFVYQPGQFAIRGGIVDIFSYSNDLPYRIEFFGDEIESIRTFNIETQLSVNNMHTVTIVPNVQSKFLSNNHISLLEYIDQDSVIWHKDIQFTLDVIKDGYKQASKVWKALDEKEIKANLEWVDPRVTFTTDRMLSEIMFEFPNIEFGKQFFYK